MHSSSFDPDHILQLQIRQMQQTDARTLKTNKQTNTTAEMMEKKKIFSLACHYELQPSLSLPQSHHLVITCLKLSVDRKIAKFAFASANTA